ncbi:MAG: hypothetical protein ACK56F_07620 [bacterium]
MPLPNAGALRHRPHLFYLLPALLRNLQRQAGITLPDLALPLRLLGLPCPSPARLIQPRAGLRDILRSGPLRKGRRVHCMH